MKLSPKVFEPYCVIEKLALVAYKLELRPTTAIHPIFHVS